MGRRGRPPKPRAILQLQGSQLLEKNPYQNAVAARDVVAIPIMPEFLAEDSDALQAWSELVPQLIDLGVLTKIDAKSLARYCVLWSRWKAAELYLRTNGSVYSMSYDKNDVKQEMQRPQVKIAASLATQLHRLEQEFGLTPSARSRLLVVSTLDRKKTNNKERFFKKVE